MYETRIKEVLQLNIGVGQHELIALERDNQCY